MMYALCLSYPIAPIVLQHGGFVPREFLQRAYILLCDYRNRGHLDKVDESGYRKITIHSERVGCGPVSSLQKQ